MTERPFAPTAARRERATKDGRIPRGRDITPIVVLLTAFCFLLVFGANLGHQMLGNIKSGISHPVVNGENSLNMSPEQFLAFSRGNMLRLLSILLPFLAVTWLAAIASQWGQVGFRWLGDKVVPDLSRVDPSTGIGRIFQWSQVIDGSLILVRLLTGALVVGCSLWFAREQLFVLGNPVQGVGSVAHSVVWVLTTACVALMVIALVDYAYRCWRFERSLWMTAEEMRMESLGASNDLRVQSLQSDGNSRWPADAQRMASAKETQENANGKTADLSGFANLQHQRITEH